MIPDRKSALQTTLSYLVWIVLTGGLFFILLYGRTALLIVLEKIIEDSFQNKYRIGVADKGFLIGGAMAAISICIVFERILAGARTWQLLAARSLMCVGIELLVIGFLTGAIQLCAGAFFANLLVVVQFGIPIIVGAVLVAMSILVRRKAT